MNALRRNTTPQTVTRARDHRRHMGRAEKRLWYDGLAKSRLGFYFRRQYAFGPYFLDFFCTETRVCVEVDGDQHEFSTAYDARRDRWLAENDVVTLRFGSDSVMIDLPTIRYRIQEVCEKRRGEAFSEDLTPPPTLPSPTGVGEAPSLEGGG